MSAALDYFHLDDVTLIGYSLGGCLAMRAAAHEPRVRRVVADDVLTDLFEVLLRQLPAAVRAMLSVLLMTRAARFVNTLLTAR